MTDNQASDLIVKDIMKKKRLAYLLASMLPSINKENGLVRAGKRKHSQATPMDST